MDHGLGDWPSNFFGAPMGKTKIQQREEVGGQSAERLGFKYLNW